MHERVQIKAETLDYHFEAEYLKFIHLLCCNLKPCGDNKIFKPRYNAAGTAPRCTRVWVHEMVQIEALTHGFQGIYNSLPSLKYCCLGEPWKLVFCKTCSKTQSFLLNKLILCADFHFLDYLAS